MRLRKGLGGFLIAASGVGVAAALYHLVRGAVIDLPFVGLPDSPDAETMIATGYVLGVPRTITLESIGNGHWLVPEAAAAYHAMASAAEADGVTLHVTSSFRTATQQAILYTEQGDFENQGGVGAKKVGWSPHQRGVAVDINVAHGTNAAYAWLTAHAYEFNFVQTAPKEFHHWAFGGMGYGLSVA